MIFSEIYGSYFKAVSAILAKAVDGALTERELTRTVLANAFGESLITIPAKLTDGSWPLLAKDYGTPLRHKPHMPLTTLEKQWLKALLLVPLVISLCWYLILANHYVVHARLHAYRTGAPAVFGLLCALNGRKQKAGKTGQKPEQVPGQVPEQVPEQGPPRPRPDLPSW